MPYSQHLARSEDLVTAHEDTRAGFVALALQKNVRATPFIEQARALKASASKARTAADLIDIREIRAALLTAAGVSDKASNHLQDADKTEAIQGLITEFLEPAGRDFVEELVFRFLLTRGDSLGGSMRNVAGQLGKLKFTRAVIAALTLAGTPYQWRHRTARRWMSVAAEDTDIQLHLNGLSWSIDDRIRTMVYDRTPSLVSKNVDLSLLNCSSAGVQSAFQTPAEYIALGELKGGIDPAGADEHWKTARTALTRIRDAFSRENLSPHTFFVGAAIEADMATEIWGQLEDGSLTNAANLTKPDQLASLCAWLCGL